MNIDVFPHDENFEEYQEVPEDPDELIGSTIQYTVSIKEIKELSENYCRRIYIEYESFYNKAINTTKIIGIDTKKTVYELNENYEHQIEYITREDVEHFKTENVLL